MEKANKHSPNEPFKVVIIGAESTGKSWISIKLAEHFKTSYCPEFLREYASNKLAINRQLTFEDNFEIVEGQIDLCSKAKKDANKLFFVDTDVFQTYIYSMYYYGKCQCEIVELVKQNQADLYLLLENDIDWHDDPLRDGLKVRSDIRELIFEKIQDLGFEFEIISGNGRKRLENAINMVKKHFIL
jgi:HTH-type transcriptional regulator, transcriptional repressor of NAD biosynthesis genes